MRHRRGRQPGRPGGAARRAKQARPAPARGDRAPLLAGHVRGGDRAGAQLLGGHGQEPDLPGAGHPAQARRHHGERTTMTGLHEALNDIAAEITPIDPPVELAMRLGHKKRHRRRIAAITGTGAVMALTAAAVVAIPALTGPASTPALTPGAATGAGIPLARPVLLESLPGNTKEYGDAHLVNTATLRLFQRLTCTTAQSGPGGAGTNDAWKATVGYTAAQWDTAGNEVVSCDASGSKYVLGQAVILGSQVTSATARQLPNAGQWVVDVTLNSAGTAAFAHLTTSQATRY